MSVAPSVVLSAAKDLTPATDSLVSFARAHSAQPRSPLLPGARHSSGASLVMVPFVYLSVLPMRSDPEDRGAPLESAAPPAEDQFVCNEMLRLGPSLRSGRRASVTRQTVRLPLCRPGRSEGPHAGNVLACRSVRSFAALRTTGFGT